jgi:hypothetical protein
MDYIVGSQPVVRKPLGSWRKRINFDAFLIFFFYISRRYWYDLTQLVSERLTLIHRSLTRKTITCNFPCHCILLEDGVTPSNEPGFGDNDSRNCRVKRHLWRLELRHLQGKYESFRRGSFTLPCATVFIQQRDFSFVGWQIIFIPVDKWLNRKVLKRQEKTEFPIEPGPPRDKPNTCNQTEGCVGKVKCQEQKVQG